VPGIIAGGVLAGGGLLAIVGLVIKQQLASKGSK
jgi:hypothetical protein